jgi:hypothetical protein
MVSQAKTQNLIWAWRVGGGSREGIVGDGYGDVAHGFSARQGFRTLVFYLPVCANGGKFSAKGIGRVRSFPGPRIRTWGTLGFVLS